MASKRTSGSHESRGSERPKGHGGSSAAPKQSPQGAERSAAAPAGTAPRGVIHVAPRPRAAREDQAGDVLESGGIDSSDTAAAMPAAQPSMADASEAGG